MTNVNYLLRSDLGLRTLELDSNISWICLYDSLTIAQFPSNTINTPIQTYLWMKEIHKIKVCELLRSSHGKSAVTSWGAEIWIAGVYIPAD